MKNLTTISEVCMYISISFLVSLSYATPSAPVADISVNPDPGICGQSIIFDGTSSHDNIDGGTIVKYQWTLPAEAVFVHGINGSKALCKFQQAGVYSITLKVWDDLGLFDEITESVQINGSNSTWYVSTSGSDLANNGQSTNNSFRTIQAAIDCADSGDTVIVSEGIYRENIYFKGNNITLKSSDPSDWSVIHNTVINPQVPGDAVIFTGSETDLCLLEGITVKGSAKSDYLQVYYDFERTTTGYVLNHEHGYDGVINGDPSFVTGNQARVDRYSMQLNGTNDYISTENFKGINSSKPRTCSAWIKTDVTSDAPIIYWGTGGDGRQWLFKVEAVTGVLCVDTGNGYIRGSTPVNTGNWIHAAAVLPEGKSCAGDILIYVDGQLEKETQTDYGMICTSLNDDVLVGKSSTEFFNGIIDEVHIYNRPLTDHEISMLAYRDNPIVNLEFENNLNDLMSSRHGTTSGDQVYSLDCQSGMFSYEFNEQNHIDLTGYKGITGTSSRTVSAWIFIDENRDSPDTFEMIAEWGCPSQAVFEGDFWLFAARDIDPDPGIYKFVANLIVGGGGVRGSIEIPQGRWTHVAAVLEDNGPATSTNNITLYVDGQHDDKAFYNTSSVDTIADYNVRVGRRVDYIQDPAGWNFDGKIDDFRIYNRPLSALEISLLAGNSIEPAEPEAHWNFDNCLEDGSGNSYHLTASNTDPGIYSDSLNNKALVFNGTDDYVISDGTADLSESYTGITGNSDRTCSAWIRTTCAGGVISWGQIDTGMEWNISVEADGDLSVDINGGRAESTTDKLIDGRWHHIAVTVSGDQSTCRVEDIRIYIDGKCQDLNITNPTASISTGNTGYVTIGAIHSSGPSFTNYFNGQIDEVAVYSCGLSEGQIQSMALKSTNMLEAHWKFDQISSGRTGEEAAGYSGSITNATLSNDGIDGSAMLFDGSDDYVEVTDYKGITGTSSRTVSAWIYIDENATDDWKAITEWGTVNTDGDLWLFTIRYHNSKLVLNVLVGGGGIIGDTEIKKGRWTHVAAVLKDDGSPVTDEIKLYVNGSADPISFITSKAINTDVDEIARIGARVTGDWEFDGMIDDLRIYSSPLTQAEINDLYSSGSGIRGCGSAATINRCIIRENITGRFGGGIWNMDGIISNCAIYNNLSDLKGGGLYGCDGKIEYCIISNNTSLGSGGFENCRAEILNCSVLSNIGLDAGGMYNCCNDTGKYIKNTIFWDNLPYDLTECSNISYCSLEYDDNITGTGIITGYPELKLHPELPLICKLGYESPCIDSGINEIDPTETLYDIDGDSINQYSYVDIGSDEFVPNIFFFDTDIYNNIQAVINDANDGDIIIIPEGIYTGTGNRDLDFHGKSILLQSTNPDDPRIVERTVIDCQGEPSDPARGFIFHSGEDSGTVVSGLTIINGYQSSGGGIICSDNSCPVVRNCTIRNCSAQKGGGIFCEQSSPLIINCLITGNNTDSNGISEGGGLCLTDYSNPTIEDCTISNNLSATKGGAVSCSINSSPTIQSCRIQGNYSGTGGGIYINQGANPDIINTVLAGNEASEVAGGGGIAVVHDPNSTGSAPTLINCTIISNKTTGTGSKGGGILVCSANDNVSLNNCIVWNNRDLYTSGDPLADNIELDQIYDLSGSAVTAAYSCIEDQQADSDHYPGTGNIDDSPGFLVMPSDGGDGWTDDNTTGPDESRNNNYGNVELDFGSRCIDAGNNSIVSSDEDISGNLRIIDGDDIEGSVVDLGAYEYNDQFHISAGKNQTVSLPNNLAFVEVPLNGKFTYPDQGPVVYSCLWSVSSALPAECISRFRFTDTETPVSSIRIYETGTYIVRLSAVRSGITVRFSEAVITVNPERMNTLPSVSIVSKTDNNDGTWQLNGLVTDDGLPTNDLDIRWSAVSVPSGGSVFFSHEDKAVTAAEFYGSGQYYLKLSASDGQLDENNDPIFIDAYTTVTVNTIVSQPDLKIYAGPDMTNIIPGSDPAAYSDQVTLSDARVIINDTGYPLTYEWSAVSLPPGGRVIFDDIDILNPTVNFNRPGIYELNLMVSDSSAEPSTDEDSVIINIINPMEVDAGIYKPVIIPDKLDFTGQDNGPDVFYDGISIDDLAQPGDPAAEDFEFRWSLVSGDGSVEFVPGVQESGGVNTSISDILNPKVYFSQTGTYTLKLTVTLTNGSNPDLTASDVVNIEVIPGNIIVEAGILNTFVIMSDSSVWACGCTNFDYILPEYDGNTRENMLIPAWTDENKTNQLKNIVCIDAGITHTLAVDNKNIAWAWGDNYEGQLSRSNQYQYEVYPVNMLNKAQDGIMDNLASVAASMLGTYTANASFGDYSILLDNEGIVWSCSNNLCGGGVDGSFKLGRDISANYIIEKVVKGQQVSSETYLHSIDSVSTGSNFTLALDKPDEDSGWPGKVYAFGNNYRDTLGNGGTSPSPLYAPQIVLAGQQDPDFDPVTNKTHLENIISVSAGFEHAMALEKNEEDEDSLLKGHVYTWGRYGSESSRTYIENDTEGPRQAGRLGIGYYESSPDTSWPRKVIRKDGSYLTDIVDISAGGDHCLALDRDGHVWAWGDNTFGQLGTGTAGSTENSYIAVKVKMVDIDGTEKIFGNHCRIGNGIVSISAGANHSAAVDSEGQLWAWGSNKYGQLGIGASYGSDDNYVTYPVRMQIKGKNKAVNTRTEIEYNSIQAAVGDELTISGDTIAVYPGQYCETVTINKDIVLTSLDPNDPDIVAATVINGGWAGENYESDGLVSISSGKLTGFTISNYINGILVSGDCIIENNNIKNNKIGIHCVSGTNLADISHNYIYNNKHFGIYYDSANSITHNNYIYQNGYEDYLIYTVPVQSGIYIKRSNVSIINNTVVNNYGSGITVHAGSGNDRSNPEIQNCIIWGNESGQLDGCQAVYSCIQDGNTSNGNINADPELNPDSYRLGVSSPCIDKGSTDEFVVFSDQTAGAPAAGNDFVCVNYPKWYSIGDRIQVGSDPVIYTVNALNIEDNKVFFTPDLVGSSYDYSTSVNCFGKVNGITLFSETALNTTGSTTTIEVADASRYRTGDQISFGSSTDIHVVTDIDTANNIITFLNPDDDPAVTSSTIVNNYGQGDIEYNPRIVDADDVVSVAVDMGAYEYPARKIDAGKDKSIVLTGTTDSVKLNDASVIYNGSTAPSAVPTYTWSMLKGPDNATVSFNDSGSLNPVATFSEYGKYTLQVAMHEDGKWLGSDTLKVTVNTGTNAGSDASFALGDSNCSGYILSGSVYFNTTESWTSTIPDDFSARWTCPENYISFSDENSLLTSADFSSCGVYPVTLTIYDERELEIGSDTLLVTVYHPDIEINAAVSANEVYIPITEPADAEIELYGTASGTVPDMFQWKQVKGPGNAVFRSENDTVSTVTFKEPGDYVFALLAKEAHPDGSYENIGADITETITVSYSQTAISISSQPERDPDNDIIYVSTDKQTANLYAEITGRHYDDMTWEIISKPSGSNLLIAGPTALNTWMSFDTEGSYTAAFIAEDNNGDIAAVETVRFQVGSDSPVISVDAGDDQVIEQTSAQTGILLGVDSLESGRSVLWICSDTSIDSVLQETAGSFTITVNGNGHYEFTALLLDSSDNILAVDKMNVTVNPWDTCLSAKFDNDMKYKSGEFIPGTIHDLFGHINGNYLSGINPSWSHPGSCQYINIDSNDEWNCQMDLSRPGVYPVLFTGISGSTEVGRDSCVLTVMSPEMFIDAWITDSSNRIYNKTAAAPGSEFTLNGSVIIGQSSLHDTEYYQWVLLDGPSEVTFGQSSICEVMNTSSDPLDPGRYVFGLIGKLGTQELGMSTVEVYITSPSNENVLYAGQDKSGILFGGEASIELSDAISTSGSSVSWSGHVDNPGPAAFDDDTNLHPTVTFSRPGEYKLIITSGTETDELMITVYQEENFLVVSAGTYSNISLPETLSLNNAWDVCIHDKAESTSVLMPGQSTVPTLYYKTYIWTVLNCDSDDVSFYPTRHCRNPIVSFARPGRYVLELSVTAGKENGITRTSQTVINVFDEDTDTSPPADISITAEPQDPSSLTEGDFAIIIDAADNPGQRLREIYLMHNGCRVNTFSAKPDYPEKMSVRHTMNVFELAAGVNTFTAVAVDLGQNTKEAEMSFTISPDWISSFRIVPSEVYSFDDEISINSDFNTSQNNIHIKVNGITVHTETNCTELDDIKIRPSDGNITSPGTYYVEISDGSTNTASLSFNVFDGIDSDCLEAYISNPDLTGGKTENISKQISNPTSSMLPVINDAIYHLKGTAKYDGFQELEYKIELYDGDININNIEPEKWTGNNYYRVKNMTPGYLREGFSLKTISADLLGELDFTDVPNGVYQILLTVKCGETYAYDTVRFILDCPLKIGNIRFSQEDISIPIGGVPIKVIRTYDSFTRKKDGDFGYGWTFSIASMDIELDENRDYMGSFTRRNGNDLNRDVTLTLPDGRRTTFRAVYKSSGSNRWTLKYLSSPGIDAKLETSKEVVLRYGGSYGGVNHYWIVDGQEYINQIASDIPVNLSYHDIPGWILTNGDGSKYYIARKENGNHPINDEHITSSEYQAYGKPYLDKIISPSGQKVEFVITNDEVGETPCIEGIRYYSPNIEIDHNGQAVISYDDNAAKAIKITRNSEGRIEAVYVPSQLDESGQVKNSSSPQIRYKYDGHGNLTQVLKLVNREGANEDEMYETTTYCYENSSSGLDPDQHFLSEIKDERGLSPVQYLYDDKGRLIGTKDAKGNTIQLEHSIEDRTETITDRSGNVTIYSYNEKGNVTSSTVTVNGTACTTSYKYGSRDPDFQNMPTEIKTPIGINPDGSIEYSNVTSRYWKEDKYKYHETTDPVGNTTVNCFYSDKKPAYTSYDNGRVLTEYHNTYDALDRLKTVRMQCNGKTNRFTAYIYDNKGRISHIVEADPEKVSDLSVLYDLQSTDGLPSEGYSITAYNYDSASNSPDQPYAISEPYSPGQSPVFRHFIHYNDNGSQDVSINKWEDPSDDDTQVDTIVADGTFYDDQGRAIKTVRQILDHNGNVQKSAVLSKKTYNAFGNVDTSVNQEGILVKYFYDENGNTTEVLTYESESQYDENIDDYLSSDDITGILTIVRNIYDGEGRILVTAGPYDPAETGIPDYPTGTEKVYDKSGRITQVRKWAGVTIDLDHILDLNNNIAGRKAAAIPLNAWDGTGTMPTDIGWQSNGKLPVVKSTIDTGQTGPLSYSEKIYDIAGRVKHSLLLDENACQQVTSYRYDSIGRQTEIIDPLGHYLDNPDNNILETGISLSDGTTSVTRIDIDDLKFTVYDETDNPKGNLTGTHITETQFDGNQRDYVIDPEGNKTEYTYNDLGRIIRIKHPETVFGQNTVSRHLYTHIVYDSLGRKLLETDPVEDKKTSADMAFEFKQYRYDTQGQLTQVILPAVDDPEDDPDAGPVHPSYRYIHDDYGNTVCVIDPLGRATIMKYNYMKKLTEKYEPFIPLDEQDQPMDIEDASDVYDALAIAMEWDNAPLCKTGIYDDLGFLSCEIDYKGTKKSYTYYSNNDTGCISGYPEKTEYYENSGTGADPDWNQNPTEALTYIYDRLGRLLQVKDSTDPGNEIILQQYTYDAGGRITSLSSGQGTVNYEYSPITGRKTATWTGTAGSVITRTEFAYDSMGRLEETTLKRRNGQNLASPEVTTCTYNLNGSRNTLQLANGIATQYKYNAMNRLTDVINSHTNQQTTTVMSGFSYNHLANGMRLNTEEVFDDAENHNITHQYDKLNRVIYESNYNENTSPDGYRSRYVYDLAGNRKERQVEVTNTNGTNTETITVDYYYSGKPDQLTKEVCSNRAFTAFLWNEKHVYAYAGPGDSIHYRISGHSERIGQLKAFFIGMPSAIWRYMYFITIALLPAAFLLPAVARYYRIIAKNAQTCRYSVCLYKRCLCLLLAYMFLIGPVINELGAAEVEYTNLSSASWGQNGDTLSYWYDENGSLCYKIFADVTNIENKTRSEVETYLSNNPSVNYDRYTYNLQNRISSLDKKRTGSLEEIEYRYNPQGDRIEKIVDDVSTTYLVDPFNHTGYSQVLEEWSAGQSTPDVTYTIGDDVITQADVSGVKHLLHDGHGSTRQLSGQSAQVTDSYNYDAYGMLLQENPPSPGCVSQQGTNLLYTGQYFDTSMQHYFNRSRWYNPSNGRFNRPDDHPGSMQDPQSLHKYLYCHDNPTNATDPTGEFILMLNVMSTLAEIGSAIIKYYPIISCGLAILDILTVIRIVLKAISEGISSITPGEWIELTLITATFLFGGKLARGIAKGFLRRIMGIPSIACKSLSRLINFVKSKGISVIHNYFISPIFYKGYITKELGRFDFIIVNGVEKPAIFLFEGGRKTWVLIHEYFHALQWKKYVGYPSRKDWGNFVILFRNQLEKIAYFVGDVFKK